MNPMLTQSEYADLVEIQRLLDDAYKHYFEFSDGHCKGSEGSVSINFGTYFDRRDGERIRHVSIYSYVLGPSRRHDFVTIAEALTAVKEWHKEEMDHDYSDDGWGDDE